MKTMDGLQETNNQLFSLYREVHALTNIEAFDVCTIAIVENLIMSKIKKNIASIEDILEDMYRGV